MAYAASDAVDAGNVKVAVTGAVYVGSDTATAPTTAVGKLGTGWLSVGYISEDGVVEGNTKDTNEITAWQNANIVRKVTTKAEVTYQFTMIETNTASLSLFYGQTVSGSNHTITPGSTARVPVVIDVVDGGKVIRRYAPDAEVTEMGEVTFASGDAVGYQVTMTAYPDAGIGGSVDVFYEETIPVASADPTTP